MSEQTKTKTEIEIEREMGEVRVEMDWGDNYAFSLLQAVGRIEKGVQQLSQYVRPLSPNYRQPLKAYWTFDWTQLDAEVVGRDDDGVSMVAWGGYIWMRRSGSGRYGDSVWFSRVNGKSETGDNLYLRLITFKDGGRPERLNKQVANGQPSPSVQANTPGPTPPPDPTLTAEQKARQTTNMEQFDITFVEANRSWKEPKYVKAARHKLGRAATSSHLYDALVAYEETYSSNFETLGREAANAEATLAGRALLGM